MKKELLICDRCGKQELEERNNIKRFFVPVGNSFDGVESSQDIHMIDLCPDCMKYVLDKHLFQSNSYESNCEIARSLRKTNSS